MAQRLVPFLGYEDAAAAIDWLCTAFGATEHAKARQAGADGTIWHAELDLEGSTIFLSTPAGYVASRKHRESCEIERRMHDNPWVIDGLFVEVGDVQAHCARARERGATIIRDPRGAGHRLPDLHDGGSRGPPLDVRAAARRRPGLGRRAPRTRPRACPRRGRNARGSHSG